MNGQDIYSQPGVYRGIPDETDDEPSDTKGLVASVATLLFSLPALGKQHISLLCILSAPSSAPHLSETDSLTDRRKAFLKVTYFKPAVWFCSWQLMLAAPVGWIPRSHSFSRGEVVFAQHQLWFHLGCSHQLGSVCSLEVSSAQVSI